MNMFKTTSAKTPQEYLTLIEEPRQTEVKKLHEFITNIIPEQKPYLQGGMIGYGTYHYKYASGREGDWCIIALASQKNYISIYICATQDGKYIPELYKNKLPKANIGKSCIRFKKTSDIDLDILKRIILEGVKEGIKTDKK